MAKEPAQKAINKGKANERQASEQAASKYIPQPAEAKKHVYATNLAGLEITQ